jgi:hypothetical protein
MVRAGDQASEVDDEQWSVIRTGSSIGLESRRSCTSRATTQFTKKHEDQEAREDRPGLTRFLCGLLYEIRPLDLTTFIGMSALLFAVGLLASYLPARKAASVGPIVAMRTD